MKFVKLAGLSLCAGVAALSIDLNGASAQQPAAPAQPAAAAKPQLTLDQVLQAVRAERRASSEENKQREQRFLSERNNQQAELNRVRQQVAAAGAESTRLEGVMEANQKRIEELSAELATKQGEFQELFGAARSAAGDLAQQVESSQISAQFPGRESELREIAQTETLPTEEQLVYLWDVLLQQVTEQAKVVTFNADVVGANGKAQEQEVTRIGPFVTFSNGKYLVYKNGQLGFLARQPAGTATDAARRVENAKGEGFVRGVIDPSLGTLLGLIVESPTTIERIKQGRNVGYTIIIVSLFAMALGIYKWLTLTMTAGAVNAQVRRKKPSKANPLGRVMLAYESARSSDVETVALKLDDAILKEVPKLESGLNLVKVIAAVAPLLGLLGTVIGMINTFQAITLFGTGDPQIMASGISEALVTTVLGLVAAIPLLLLHAFASGASRRVTQILEEQAAGIIAEHAEGGSR
ncbi:MAG: MotA/TolQ/ExbB proton channel family protein [Amphiplicatus sp.]